MSASIASSGGPGERGAPPGRLRFLGALHELVAIGLYKPALEALIRGEADAPRPPIDRAYLLKVLEEEVGRQFGHPLRPIVEIVLNGSDASRFYGRVVDVYLGDGSVEVVDAGEGMNLRSVLSKLLVPFATDKTPGADVGRFGVGFFSVLGYGITDPASFSLHVETGDGRESWSLRVVACGGDAASLTVSVREIARLGDGGPPPRRGTRVRVSSALLEPDGVRAYLRDALHFFPPERAVLRIDGAPFNDGSLLSGGQLYEDAAAPGLTGRFHLGGRGLGAGVTAATYHAGVKVESCFAVGELALIDFPASVEITEGRDALKPGPALNAVAAAFHRRLARIAEESSARGVRERIAELAAQISALMLQSAAWADVAPELGRRLLGPDRFLISPDRAETVLGFLGQSVQDRIFVPESFWAEREWHSFLPKERELLEDEMTFEPPEMLATLARRRPDLAGLDALLSRAANPSSTVVMLAHGKKRPAGTMPCLGTRRAIAIHADSPAVRAPRGWTDLYALRTSFDRAAGLREADVERDLIVSSPIGAAPVHALRDLAPRSAGEPMAAMMHPASPRVGGRG